MTATTCCSNQSERWHRCCNLPNNFSRPSYYLYNAMDRGCPPEIAPSPPYTWFPEPTRVHIPNSTLIGLAVFYRLRSWPTDRQTEIHTHMHKPCYICSSGRYLCTACMRRVLIMVTTDRSSSTWNFLTFCIYCRAYTLSWTIIIVYCILRLVSGLWPFVA